MKVTAHQFNSEFTQLVRQERGLNREVVEMIAFCIKKRFFAELGYSSVMGWLIKGHGYPKNCAYRRIEAAKLLTSVPNAIEKLEEGKVNLSTLATLQSAIRREEVRTSTKIDSKRRGELFEMIEDKTEEQAERIVATEFPNIIKDKIESVKPVSANETRVNLIFSKEDMAILERVREVTGHSHFNASWSEIVIAMAVEFLKHKDPVQRAERSLKRAESKLGRETRGMVLDGSDESAGPGLQMKNSESLRQCTGAGLHFEGSRGQSRIQVATRVDIAPRKESPASGLLLIESVVSSQLRDVIICRDGGRCSFVDPIAKSRCDCRTQLEVDHIIPRALGGTNDSENLRALCRTHNRLLAEVAFGRQFISERIESKDQRALLAKFRQH